MTFALFGIQNDGLNLAVNLLVFFLFVIWLALVYWTYADASRRLDDPMLVACATAARCSRSSARSSTRSCARRSTSRTRTSASSR